MRLKGFAPVPANTGMKYAESFLEINEHFTDAANSGAKSLASARSAWPSVLLSGAVAVAAAVAVVLVLVELLVYTLVGGEERKCPRRTMPRSVHAWTLK